MRKRIFAVGAFLIIMVLICDIIRAKNKSRG